MADTEAPRLIVPFTGEHLLSSLNIARQDPDAFRHDEMQWLQRNGWPIWEQITGEFSRSVKLEGIDSGNARILGCVLGHNAVRLSLPSSSPYDQVRDNYVHNVDADRVKQVEGDALWASEAVLSRIFGDEELVAALLTISHEKSCDAASLTIGRMCLTEMPAPATSAAAGSN